jgi:hypothetical protein
MSLRFSQGTVNNVAMGEGWGDVIKNSVCVVYSGSQPATPEVAATAGTELVRFTLASGALTAPVRGTAKIVLASYGTAADVVNMGLNVGAAAVVSLTGGNVTGYASLALLTQATVDAINNNWTYPDFRAVMGGSVVGAVTYGAAGAGEFYVIAPKNSGTAFNTATVTFANTTTTANINGGGASTTATGAFGPGTGGSTAGVAAVNGLTMTYPASAGLISNYGVWSGVASATGTAGWFRIICTPNYDTGLTTLSTSGNDTLFQMRIDGTVGTSGADMIVTSTSVTSTVTQTVSSFALTVPAT